MLLASAALAGATALSGETLRAAEPALEPPVLTLDEALTRALAENRQVASATLEVARAKDRLAATKARRLPTLNADVIEARLLTPVDFEFEKGVFGTYDGIGPVPARNTTISTPRSFTTTGIARLSQPISQLYSIGLGVKARALGAEVAGEELRETRREIAGSVRSAYFGALRAEKALVAARESARLAAELERLASEAVARETALAGDLLEARARRAASEADVATLEEALATSKELLNAHLARDVSTEFRLADIPETPFAAPDLQAARREARERRPGARQARLGAGIAELDAKMARADLYPEVSLTVAYLSPFGTELLPKNIVTAGLLLSWEVFDGGRKARELAEKRKGAQQAWLKAREAEELAAVEVARDARKIEETRRLLAASRLSREAAAERLRVAKNRYDASSALLSDLLKAQTNLADASRRESEALLSYWTARADFEKSHGEDL